MDMANSQEAVIGFEPRDFTYMSDAELFSLNEWYGNADFVAFKKEKDRRINEKREEQDRIERERTARLNAIKENLTYSDRLAQTICERISAGELLTVLCREDDMPTMRNCNTWLKEHAEFQALMDMAKNDRLNIFEEEVIEIADDMKNDFKTVIKNGKEKRVADPDMVARARLRIEVRWKCLKSGRPQKWGDVSTLITKSDDPNDATNLSQEELEKRIADMDTKERVFRAA
jgi:hypothetical protein